MDIIGNEKEDHVGQGDSLVGSMRNGEKMEEITDDSRAVSPLSPPGPTAASEASRQKQLPAMSEGVVPPHAGRDALFPSRRNNPSRTPFTSA